MPPEPHACPTDRPCPWSTALRAIECFLLFGVFPVLVDLKTQSRLLIPFLVVCAIGIFIYLMTSKDFDRRKLINLAGFKRELPRILITWVLGALSLIAVVWWLDKQPATPEQVTPFGFPSRNPRF